MVRNRKPTARAKHSDKEILKALKFKLFALTQEGMCSKSIKQLPTLTF